MFAPAFIARSGFLIRLDNATSMTRTIPIKPIFCTDVMMKAT